MKYVDILNDLTDKECRVFMYCMVLGYSAFYTAQNMDIGFEEVNHILSNIKHDTYINKLANKIRQSYEMY